MEAGHSHVQQVCTGFQLLTKITANKRVSNIQIRQTRGMPLQLRATPRPLFDGNISVADCMALSSLLKTMNFLPAASNADVYEKLAVLDECLVDDCWMVTCDHHLDDRLSLSHVS